MPVHQHLAGDEPHAARLRRGEQAVSADLVHGWKHHRAGRAVRQQCIEESRGARLGFGGPPAPPNTGVPLNANLVGFTEVPGPGDGAGSGRITVVVDPPKQRLCYMFFGVRTTDAPTAAHIHTGAAGAAGGPVVTLQAPADGSGSGCQDIAADLAQALVSNPAGYYVNVHTAQFPQGAIRGQLSN